MPRFEHSSFTSQCLHRIDPRRSQRRNQAGQCCHRQQRSSYSRKDGRFFTSGDRASRPKTVIINRELAQEYFPGEDPLGKHLHVVPYGNADHEIVGVVANTLYQVGQRAKAAMYFPVLNGDNNPGGLTLAVVTASDPLAFSVSIQKADCGARSGVAGLGRVYHTADH